MPAVQLAGEATYYLPRDGLDALVTTLRESGYTVLGPKVADGIISLQPVTSAEELPRGIRDEHDGGHYRLLEGDPDLLFDHVLGPDGPKSHLLPPILRLFTIRATADRFALEEGAPSPPRLAFLGIRPCEVAAMEIQDRVFGTRETGTFRCEADSYYQEARRESLVVAVNCTHPGKNCFCDSMGTGPIAKGGFDLALTELRGGFLVQSGSPKGAALLEQLPVRQPTPAELELGDLKLRLAVTSMQKALETEGLAETLSKAIEHPHWDDVDKRCLGCGNCTQVCPTCFCSTVVDATDLSNEVTTRTRLWESCHTHQFSYTTSGPVRGTIRARYRHWLRHKLSTWHEQFGTNGCVGCGRCITWCPAGIDITAEAAAVCGDWQPAAHHAERHGKGVAS